MDAISAIVKSLKTNVVLDDSVKGVAAGLEARDTFVRQTSEEKIKALSASIESALNEVTLDNGISSAASADASNIKIDDAQVAAAKTVAMYAIDPEQTLKKFAQGRKQIEVGSEDRIVDTIKYTNNVLTDEEIRAGFEAFDGQVLDNSLYFSVAYNALALKQDPVAELFYPVIVIDPSYVGATVKAKITNIMQAVNRDVSGRPVNFKRESIIKKLNDTSLFTLDANRLFPVYDKDSGDKGGNLLVVKDVNGLIREVEVMDGVKIKTAPLASGKKIDILGISQNDVLLSSGYMDETDALYGSLSVEKLYFKVQGKDSDGNDVTDYMSLAIKGLPAAFTYTPTGSTKDIQLDYKTSSLALRAGNIVKVDGTPTDIADLANLPTGYTIKLAANIKGDGNVQDGYVAIYPVEFKLHSVLDASGNPLPEDDDTYKKVKNVIDTAKILGYDLEAYAANSNARFRGKLLTSNSYQYVYTVPVRTKIRELVPVFNTGDDGDTAGIVAQIDFTKRAMSKLGLSELINTATVLDNVSEDTEDFGISTKLVNKYFYKGSIDFTTLVNSIKSSDREADIEAALRLTIRNAAIDMYVKSNYNFAFESLFPGVKPTVIIGTDYNVGRFLKSFEDEIFRYVVKVSGDSLVAGKVFISFGIMGADRNKQPNMLNFGACFWSPEVVISLQRTEGGKAAQETIIMPRFKHQTLMPILTVFEVSGIEAVSGKVTVDFHQV